MFFIIVASLFVLAGCFYFVLKLINKNEHKTEAAPSFNPLAPFADELRNFGLSRQRVNRITGKPLSPRYELPTPRRLDNGELELFIVEGQGNMEPATGITFALPIINRVFHKNYYFADPISDPEMGSGFLLREVKASDLDQQRYENLCATTKLTQTTEVLGGGKNTVSATFHEDEDSGDVVINTANMSINRSHIEGQMETFINSFGRKFSHVETESKDEYRLVCVTEARYYALKHWEEFCKKHKMVRKSDKEVTYPFYEERERQSGEQTKKGRPIVYKDLLIERNGVLVEERALTDALPDLMTMFARRFSHEVQALKGGNFLVKEISEAAYKERFKFITMMKDLGLVRFSGGKESGGGRAIYPEFAEMDTGDIAVTSDPILPLTKSDLDKALEAVQANFNREFKYVDDLGGGKFILKIAIPRLLPFKRGMNIWTHKPVYEAEILAVASKEKKATFFLGQVLDSKVEMPNLLLVDVATNPHFLVVGQTRSGKTKTVLSLVYNLARSFPGAVFFFADGKSSADYDPFAAALSAYPVAKAANPSGNCLVELQNIINAVWLEMESRKPKLEKMSVSTIAEYNLFAAQKGLPQLPRVFLVIDEFAAFSMEMEWTTNFKRAGSISNKIKRLGAEAASVGIHLVIASQRPHVSDVPSELRAQLVNWLVHSIIKNDWGVAGVETVNLNQGEYYLRANGVFCPRTGVDAIKCTMPYIGDVPNDLIASLPTESFADAGEKRDFNHYSAVAVEGDDAPEEWAPELVFANFADGVRSAGWEVTYIVKTNGDCIRVPICATASKGGVNVAFSFTSGELLGGKTLSKTRAAGAKRFPGKPSWLMVAVIDKYGKVKDIELDGTIIVKRPELIKDILTAKTQSLADEEDRDFLMEMITEAEQKAEMREEENDLLGKGKKKGKPAAPELEHSDDGYGDEYDSGPSPAKVAEKKKRTEAAPNEEAVAVPAVEGEEEGQEEAALVAAEPRPGHSRAEGVSELGKPVRGAPKAERRRLGGLLECLGCSKMFPVEDFQGPSKKGAPKRTCLFCRGEGKADIDGEGDEA